MPQIVEKPFMAADNGQSRRRRQGTIAPGMAFSGEAGTGSCQENASNINRPWRPAAADQSFLILWRYPGRSCVNPVGAPMRFAAVLLAFACIASPALAESRIFIVANQPDGYGVDRCLASGDKCGMPLARAYCQQRDFAQAASFRRIDRDEVTGAIPAEACSGPGCGEYVAITCQR